MVTLRIRSVMWFAAGLAIAIALVWSFTAWRASAIGPNESTFVPVTPVRILDSRDPTNVGLAGPFVSALSQDLQVTGSIPTTTGNQIVVPTGATGVLLNVTAVSPTANGFLSIRPADAPGAPTTSSLNVVSGEILPNGVAVSLPTAGADAGKIEITFDAYGTAGPTTDILIDVVGYTTNTGLQDLEARLTALRTAPIVMSHGPGSATINAIAPTGDLEPVVGRHRVHRRRVREHLAQRTDRRERRRAVQPAASRVLRAVARRHSDGRQRHHRRLQRH